MKRFAPRASCSRVVYEYCSDKGMYVPPQCEGTVEETDTIDSFNYRAVEEWKDEALEGIYELRIAQGEREAGVLAVMSPLVA